jgi:pyruvate,water dikinase
MDIEWAKDGLNNQLYIVQADQKRFMEEEKTSSGYKLKEKRTAYHKGIALGDKIASEKLEYFIIKKQINCWRAKFSSQT